MEEENIKTTSSNPEFKTSTVFYENLFDRMLTVAKDSSALMRLKKYIAFISDKNMDVLSTNIIGYPLLINDKDQDTILSIIGLTKKELVDICMKSPRMDGVGKILDQFSFALPLIILSGALHKIGNKEMSQGIFTFAFYRPYSSKITAFFTYGVVDEKAMEYTTMIELDNKSFIHKYGSVLNVINESAKSAYYAFIDQMSCKNGYPTDDLVFNNIFYSAIFSKTGSWIKSVYGTYLNVKKSGKALNYEASQYSSYDDDSGDDQYEENNISSASAVKRQVVSKAASKFNISPIDIKLVSTAAAYGNGSPSKAYEALLTQTLSSISKIKSEIIPQYFDAIVGSFLDNADVSGNLNSSKDISTVKFLAYSKRNFKISHTDNLNIHEEQNITEELLLDCCPKYVTAEIKTKRKIKLALYMYFVLYIQKA